MLAPLRAQLDAWNQTPRQQRFAHRFKALFTRYQRGLEREATAARLEIAHTYDRGHAAGIHRAIERLEQGGQAAGVSILRHEFLGESQ